jgi:hypothetical protein
MTTLPFNGASAICGEASAMPVDALLVAAVTFSQPRYR